MSDHPACPMHCEASAWRARLVAAEAALADANAEIARLIAEYATHEKANISSRRSICEQSDRYNAQLAGTGKRPTKMAAVPSTPLVPSCGGCVRWAAFGKVPCPEHLQAQETA